MKLIWRLLRQNINVVQLGGFFLANLAGITIILVACQFYFDISPIFSQKDDMFRRDYFTITKKVSLMNAFSSNSGGFSQREIEDLRNTGFVKDLGAFTSSQFGVHASISQGGMGFNTEMFFESVPDKFVDIKPDNWHFAPGDNVIPIILPKNYLDLYNFGFADSRSMPKITENMIGVISLDITLWGNGKQQNMKGKIVGFSNRLNTILVPESFMIWANRNLGNNQNINPSRIILDVNNIADTQIAGYFKEKGYEVEGDNAAVSRMSSLLKILVAIVVAVGVIICLLSFVILTLSIYLLLEKNMEKLFKLRLLGYSRLSVTKPYEMLVIGMNLLIFIIAAFLVILVKTKYSAVIGKIWTSFEPGPIWISLLIGLGIFVLLSVLNILIIRKKIR